jgi:hypothetical protein
MIKKEMINDFKEPELIHVGETSKVYRLQDQRIIKIVSPLVLMACKASGISYEDKIHNTAAKKVKEIVCPLTAVYDGTTCVGYTMEEVKGVSLNSYDDNYSLSQRSNLNEYAKLYAKIEEVVMKANKLGIVMPDLCTCDNIIFLPDGSVKFIDFDGMQFGSRDKSLFLSTSLGEQTQYTDNRKYSFSLGSFTKELDKNSLARLMFLWVFNKNLCTLGMDINGHIVTLEDVFETLGLGEEKQFFDRISRNLSIDRKGVYLQDELFRIAEQYDMYTAEVNQDIFLKVLKRK